MYSEWGRARDEQTIQELENQNRELLRRNRELMVQKQRLEREVDELEWPIGTPKPLVEVAFTDFSQNHPQTLVPEVLRQKIDEMKPLVESARTYFLRSHTQVSTIRFCMYSIHDRALLHCLFQRVRSITLSLSSLCEAIVKPANSEPTAASFFITRAV